jgi:hypothetical protein
MMENLYAGDEGDEGEESDRRESYEERMLARGESM